MRSHKAKYSRRNTDFGKNGFGNTEARKLPFFTKIQIFFSGVMAIIGIEFLLMGSLFMFVFGMLVNFDDLKFSKNDPITTNVEIISTEATSATENERPVYKYNYSYKTLNEKEYKGFSYSSDSPNFKNGGKKVQYLEDNPSISKIVGMRKGTFSPWILLILSIFPIIGVVMSYIGLKKNLEYIKLVKYGKIAFGTFSHSEPTGESINKQKVWKYFFDFTADDDNDYLGCGKTHIAQRLRDEEKERLVYNPQNPNENVMIDALPISVKKFFDRNSF